MTGILKAYKECLLHWASDILIDKLNVYLTSLLVEIFVFTQFFSSCLPLTFLETKHAVTHFDKEQLESHGSAEKLKSAILHLSNQ